jgi:hypothetical protein
MKNTFLSFLLSFILIVVFLGSSVTTFSQTKEVYVELDRKKQEYPIYIEVPNKGIIVLYLTLDKTTQYNVLFFDENLQEKWKISDISSPKKIVKGFYNNLLNYGKELINGVVTPDGKYAYIANIIDDVVYRIDIATGKWEAIPLAKKLIKDKYGFPRGYTINFNVDENYYYLSEIGHFLSNSDISKRNKITVNRIKHGENKFESFSFSPTPANGKEKPDRFGFDQHSSGDMQQWEVFFIKDNKIILKDNYPIHKDENNAFYRKMVVYNLEGKILSKANLPMGHTVSYTREYYSGVISYNKIKDKIYTFTYINDNEKSGTILYKCYDLNLKLLWEKTYTIKMEDYNKKKSSFFKQVNHNYDNTISLLTYDGAFTIDSDGSNPNFKKHCLEENQSYKVNCYEFEKANKLSSTFISNDYKKLKALGKQFSINLFKVKDKIIYTITVDHFAPNADFYRLATFDIK